MNGLKCGPTRLGSGLAGPGHILGLVPSVTGQAGQMTREARPYSAYRRRPSHCPQPSSAISFTGIPTVELYKNWLSVYPDI